MVMKLLLEPGYYNVILNDTKDMSNVILCDIYKIITFKVNVKVQLWYNTPQYY